MTAISTPSLPLRKIITRIVCLCLWMLAAGAALADEPTPPSAANMRQGPPGWLNAAPTPPAAAAAATPDEPKGAQPHAGPCERGEMRLKLAGMDPDVTRCQVFLLGQQIADSTTQATALAAQNLLDKKDRDEAAANAAAREKQWADYFAAYIGATPPSPPPPAPFGQQGGAK